MAHETVTGQQPRRRRCRVIDPGQQVARTPASSWRCSRCRPARRRAPPGRAARRPGPSGGRRRSATAPAEQPGMDGQAVVGLVDVAAEPLQLGGQRGQPVGLVARGCGRCRAGGWCRRPARRRRRPPGSARWPRRRSRSTPWSWSVPRTVRPRSSKLASAPNAVRTSRIASPGWSVDPGQCGTVTAPPVMAAAARNGAALDRSGSIVTSRGGDRPGRDHPAVGLGVVDPDVPLAEHGHGHLDVRPGGERRAGVAQVERRRAAGRRPAAGR